MLPRWACLCITWDHLLLSPKNGILEMGLFISEAESPKLLRSKTVPNSYTDWLWQCLMILAVNQGRIIWWSSSVDFPFQILAVSTLIVDSPSRPQANRFLSSFLPGIRQPECKQVLWTSCQSHGIELPPSCKIYREGHVLWPVDLIPPQSPCHVAVCLSLNSINNSFNESLTQKSNPHQHPT